MIDFIARINNIADQQSKEADKRRYRKKFETLSPEYKHHLSGSFVLVDGNKIETGICGSDIIVTRKIDGEMRTIYFDGEQCYMYTTGGKEEKDFPCLVEMAALLKKAGISSCGIAAELTFVSPSHKRTRVSDVVHAIATPSLHNQLALYAFDILFLNDEQWVPSHYSQTYEKLELLFGKTDISKLVTVVQMEKAENPEQVRQIYEKWVVEEKSEGLVVHSEQPIIWKIKPQHTVDAVAIGYTTSCEELRDLLFAVINENGLYRVFAHGGNGLTNEHRAILLNQLESLKTGTTSHFTDSRGAVFQMVEPKFVFEVSAIDFASENCLHQCYKNQLLSFSQEQGWSLEQIAPGVTTFSLKIKTLREDKQPVFEDCRESQISNICSFVTSETCNEKARFVKKESLPPSTILERIVYVKENNFGVYVKKFVVLKTNKEESGRFPAYFLHYSDLGSKRKDFLKKRVFISNDKAQIFQIMHNLIEKEIKTGWTHVK